MENENWENRYKIGQTIYPGGCFTLEGYIINQNLSGIAYRLGLPQSIVAHGIFIAYALRVPTINEFELAGITFDSTDKFIDYSGVIPKYDPNKFNSLYTSRAAVPINFLTIKKQYQATFHINKLVKILSPRAVHYPPGTMVPQFEMSRSVQCYVAAYIPPDGNFRA